MDILNDLVLPLASSPWVYAIALGLVILDSFFPLFPSEVVIVGLASLAASHAAPDILLLLLIAALGALIGDILTYFLGRVIGVRRLQSTRLRPLVRLLRWASRRLGRRAGMVILTARFIPWARLAVNLTAGSTGYAFWRFAPFCLAASALWAAYNVTMGYLAGHWFSGQPIIGMLAAIVLAVALGFLLDAINTRIRRNGPNRPNS
jgi:membrane protein DedA with SNARE-associated domain